MRLIDADGLRYEEVTLSGDDEVVPVIVRDDVQCAPTIVCEYCAHSDLFDDGSRFCRNPRAPVIGSVPDGFGCPCCRQVKEET